MRIMPIFCLLCLYITYIWLMFWGVNICLYKHTGYYIYTLLYACFYFLSSEWDFVSLRLVPRGSHRDQSAPWRRVPTRRGPVDRCGTGPVGRGRWNTDGFVNSQRLTGATKAGKSGKLFAPNRDSIGSSHPHSLLSSHQSDVVSKVNKISHQWFPCQRCGLE